MITLVTTVFLASLLGSLHCAGMCGPFVAFAVGQPTGENNASRTHLQLAYHGGRLVTYTLLGAAAGATGALLDLTWALAGMQPVAMALAGGLMVGLGCIELLRSRGYRIALFHPPKLLVKTVQRGQRLAMALQPTRRALVIGLLTTLLPCGWLYAFAITAAGTGSPLTGAVVMAVFWVGTLPVLISLGVGLQAALGALGKRLPSVSAIALIAVGLFTLAGRFQLDPSSLAKVVTQQQSTQHLEGSSGPSVPNPNELPPCCQEKLGSELESELPATP